MPPSRPSSEWRVKPQSPASAQSRMNRSSRARSHVRSPEQSPLKPGPRATVSDSRMKPLRSIRLRRNFLFGSQGSFDPWNFVRMGWKSSVSRLARLWLEAWSRFCPAAIPERATKVASAFTLLLPSPFSSSGRPRPDLSQSVELRATCARTAAGVASLRPISAKDAKGPT